MASFIDSPNPLVRPQARARTVKGLEPAPGRNDAPIIYGDRGAQAAPMAIAPEPAVDDGGEAVAGQKAAVEAATESEAKASLARLRATLERDQTWVNGRACFSALVHFQVSND
jgi:hypothetical protein